MSWLSLDLTCKFATEESVWFSIYKETGRCYSPGPEEVMQLLDLTVVCVICAVNDPGKDVLLQTLAVLLQSPKGKVH